MSGLGALVLAILVVGLVPPALYFLHMRFGLFNQRLKPRGNKSNLLENSRIEVLESTEVDGGRRLVLVRCDRIEHLILVGGPADVVVENDVKKVRGPGAPAPKGLVSDTGGAERPAAERPATDHQAPDAQVQSDAGIAARARLMAASGRAPPAPSAANEQSASEARTQTRLPRTDNSAGRRERAPQRPAIQPTPLGATRTEHQPQADRRNGGQAESAGLPSAGVPWAEPDSIENEIVRALRVDPVARGRGSAGDPERMPAARKDASDSSTTLGDLADRLEEALAQEVQAASHDTHTVSAEDFAFGDGDRTERSKPDEQKPPAEQQPERLERPPLRRETAKSDRITATPEPERRQQGTGERREEAPVISLNARRREASDPLEDEMARLLGELTGDNKGR